MIQNLLNYRWRKPRSKENVDGRNTTGHKIRHKLNEEEKEEQIQLPRNRRWNLKQKVDFKRLLKEAQHLSHGQFVVMRSPRLWGGGQRTRKIADQRKDGKQKAWDSCECASHIEDQGSNPSLSCWDNSWSQTEKTTIQWACKEGRGPWWNQPCLPALEKSQGNWMAGSQVFQPLLHQFLTLFCFNVCQ